MARRDIANVGYASLILASPMALITQHNPKLTSPAKNRLLQWCILPVEYRVLLLMLIWRAVQMVQRSAPSPKRGLHEACQRLPHLVTFIDTVLNIHSPAISSFAPSISPFHPTEGIGQGLISDISERQGCPPFCSA